MNGILAATSRAPVYGAPRILEARAASFFRDDGSRGPEGPAPRYDETGDGWPRIEMEDWRERHKLYHLRSHTHAVDCALIPLAVRDTGEVLMR